MFDLNKLIVEAYEEEKSKDFSFDRLVEMVEAVMVMQESLGIIKEEAPIDVKAEKTEDLKPVKILWRPYVQMSEVAWGSTAHQSADARDIDGDGEVSIEEQNPAREQLKLYLSALPEGDIKQKLDDLNAFIKNINSDSPAIDGIGKAVSFMMFYRTLYDIINDFNASAAGFIFESFLSVLLDAQSGHQIPASGASTIADFVVYPNGGRIPISLKLYSADTLKVGGSYIQLVKDLTGEFGMMQYIVITKVSGDNDEIQKLKFHSFNFTRDNFAKILSLTGETGLNQMCLPESITTAYTKDKKGVKNILRSGLNIAGSEVKFKQTYDPAGASEFDPTGQFINPKRRQRFDIALDIPPKTRISIKPAFDGIEAALENEDGTALKSFLREVGDRNADKIKQAFLDALNKDFKVPSLNSGIDDIEIGQSQNPETPKVYAYNSKGTNTNIKTTTTMPKIYDAVLGVLDAKQLEHPNITKFTSPKDILRQFIKGVVGVGKAAQEKSPKPKEGEDPHTLRVKAIYGERSKEQKEISVDVLSDPYFKPTEKMRLLKLTAGYQGIGGDSQFELKTKAAFRELYKAEYAGELPYGPVDEKDGSFAELVLTKEEVLKTCNNVLESFNRNMSEALNGMQMLVNDMNAYVLSGLKDDKKATDASQDAQIVKTSMDKQVQESAQNNTETP